MLYSKDQGINAFLFCAKFIDETAHGSAIAYPILNCLYLLNSLDPRVDLEKHPKLFAVFNNIPVGLSRKSKRALIK